MSAGACTLQVYGDHLYIGDYNDVSSALQGFVTKSNFVTQATNLEQSVNLYRMDKNENVEMLVGDKNDTFPKGGSTGLGSGYDNHMNQYTADHRSRGQDVPVHHEHHHLAGTDRTVHQR